MTLPRTSVRLLGRGAAAALLAGTVSLVGAPTALADEAAPAIAAAPDREAGWVEDVRADSADSTKTVAGIAVVVVAGCITAVAVRPNRRPPAGG